MTNTPFEIQSELQAVMVWTAKVACDHVDLAHVMGEHPKTDISEGLWQSFREDFDKATHEAMGIRNLAITVLGQTFRSTVELMDAKARQVATVGATVDGSGPVKMNDA